MGFFPLLLLPHLKLIPYNSIWILDFERGTSYFQHFLSTVLPKIDEKKKPKSINKNKNKAKVDVYVIPVYWIL